MDTHQRDAIDDVAVLADPVRRQLFSHVSAQAEPVGRDAAAAAAGISRALAAFHLDRLVAAGLLRPTYRRLSGRTGPGAGRPAKLYERSDRDIDLSLPRRRYDVAATLFAEALERGVDHASTRDALDAAAHAFGRSLGEDARRRAGSRPGRQALLAAAVEVLAEAGFEPTTDNDGLISLRNCPFDALARTYRDLMCGTNLTLMSGVIDGLRSAGIRASLEPRPGMCCVVWRSGSGG